MAVGTIQFSVSTNPIDALNARLKALGRKETATSVNSSSEPYGYIGRDIYYRYADGKRSNFKYLQQPTDSPDSLAEKFLAHLCDSEYQQYLGDHKAITLGSLFGENRFPRARERAFLDFRTQAASQTRYESFDYSDPHVGIVKKVLDAYLTHTLPGLPSIKCDLFVAVEHDHTVVQMSAPMPDWRKCRTIRIPLSQDMPWYTAAQQARDTLKEWIASAKESVATEQNNPSTVDYTVWIWGIEYPNARVEYHESFERMPSRPGFDRGIYGAGAKTSGVPRTEEPFDITIAYKDGNTVILRGCWWVADGEVCCERIETNGKSALMPSKTAAQKVAAKQKIPVGAMVASDGEVVGKATPARGMAYLNGVPIGFVSSIDHNGGTVVQLGTDNDSNVTTTAQQVKEAIDRSNAISVPTEDKIEQTFLDRIAQDGGGRPPVGGTLDSIASAVAASTHDTCKAMESLGRDMRAGFEQSRTRFDNLSSQPLTRDGFHSVLSRVANVTADKDGNFVMSLETQLPQPPANIPLDFAPQIGDTVTKETASMPGIYEPVTPAPTTTLRQRATTEAIEVAYRTAAIKLPDLVKRQLVKRMAAKGGKRPSQARLSLAEEMLSGDEGSLIVAGILSLALSASPEFIKTRMPWLDLDRLARELRLNVETRIACAVADMLGMYLDGALEALKEAFGGSQQLLLAEGGKSDESALFNGVPKAESVGVR